MRKWMLLLEGGAAAEWLEDGTASGPRPGYDKSITYPEGDAMIVLKDGKSGPPLTREVVSNSHFRVGDFSMTYFPPYW